MVVCTAKGDVDVVDVSSGKSVYSYGSDISLYDYHLDCFAYFTHDGDRIVYASDKGLKVWEFKPLQELIDETKLRFKNVPLTAEERQEYYLE